MVIHGKARRFALGLLVALLLAMFVREATAQMIPTPPACKNSTPDDWEWWANWCWNYPSASAMQPRGFIVR